MAKVPQNHALKMLPTAGEICPVYCRRKCKLEIVRTAACNLAARYTSKVRVKRIQSNLLQVRRSISMPKPFPHRRPSDNHIAIVQDLHRRSAPVDILASYQNHLTPEPKDVEGIRGPQIGIHNTDSGYRGWGVGDLGEYFSAFLDRAFCPHEVKSLSGKI